MGKKNERPQMNPDENGAEPTGAFAPPIVPSFTIRANSAFGIFAMMAIARMHGVSHEERKALNAKLREFDLYEEQARAGGKSA